VRDVGTVGGGRPDWSAQAVWRVRLATGMRLGRAACRGMGVRHGPQAGRGGGALGRGGEKTNWSVGGENDLGRSEELAGRSAARASVPARGAQRARGGREQRRGSGPGG
jgi:hypothetical protein